MIKTGPNLSRGVTMLETVIYVALLAFILTFVFSSVIAMSRAASGARVSRDVNNSASNAMDRMIRMIRDGSSVNETSVFDTNLGQLYITSSGAYGGAGTIAFAVNASSSLVVKDGTSASTTLTVGSVEVQSLIFRRLLTTNGDGVRIEMTLAGDEGSAPPKTYYGTAVMRESYQ